MPPSAAVTRIAIPDSLLPRLEGAAHGSVRPFRLVAAHAPKGEEASRQDLRLQRIWLEQRRGHGSSASEAEAALRSGSMRALLLVQDGQADAAVLDETDPLTAQAWQSIEPESANASCADLWLTWLDGAHCGWFDWPASAELSQGVSQFLSAAGAASRGFGNGATPLLLDFSNGRDPAAPRWNAVAQTLHARSPQARRAMLYSPLFYREGRLDAPALLRALQHFAAETAPVLCAPRLARSEFASALRVAGGIMSGRLRAGAEIPAARLAADADLASARATLDWICAVSKVGVGPSAATRPRL